MDIHSCVEELDGLVSEIKQLQGRLRFLKKRKVVCEGFVEEYIKAHNHPGIRYKDIVITHQVRKRRYKGTQQAQHDRVMGVLEKYNMANDAIIRELLDASKGVQEEKEVLNFTKT